MRTLEQITARFPDVQARAGAIYIPNYGDPEPEWLEEEEQNLLQVDWRTQTTARHEAFMSHKPRTYSYGNRGTGEQIYHSQPFHPTVERFLIHLNKDFGTEFNVCFLNKYDNEHQHLGWHADSFPGMRKDQPIFSVSFGAAREIWVKDKRGYPCLDCGLTIPENCYCGGSGFVKEMPHNKQPKEQRFLLEPASIFIMPPGYQDTHLHRIPKHDRPCGWRISLTFRSFE